MFLCMYYCLTLYDHPFCFFSCFIVQSHLLMIKGACFGGEKFTPFNFKIITQLSTMKLHHAKKSLYKVVKHSRKYNHHISLFVFHCTKLYHSFQMYYGSEGKRNETFPKHSFLSKQRTKMDQLASR